MLILVFGEKWLSHGEYARTLAASCQREEAQPMKQSWQDHIEAAATVYEGARSMLDASSGRTYLDSLEWQVPLAFSGFDIDSDGHWVPEEEVRGPQ